MHEVDLTPDDKFPPPPLKNKMFFREGVRKKGESTGLRGVPFSCQFVKLFWLLYIWKITRMAFPQKKVIFPGGGVWGEDCPLKIIGKKLGATSFPGSSPTRPYVLSHSLSRSIGTGRREAWEWGWNGGLCFQDTQNCLLHNQILAPCFLLYWFYLPFFLLWLLPYNQTAAVSICVAFLWLWLFRWTLLIWTFL